jgi:hypothetical protein
MKPIPETSTSMSSGTVMLTPPIRQNVRIVTSGAVNLACRRSSSTPPMMATAV